MAERKNSIQSHGVDKRKIGPIDLSVLDSRKGPSQQRSVAPAMAQSSTAKTTTGFFKSFGFGAQGGGADSEGKLNDGKNPNDPQAKEDAELGIDRAGQDPIKFVSAIDSKPIYPPYLQLADFDSYIMKDANG